MPKRPKNLNPHEIKALLNTRPTEQLQKEIASEKDGNFASMPIDELIGNAEESKRLPLDFDVVEEDPREEEKKRMKELDG